MSNTAAAEAAARQELQKLSVYDLAYSKIMGYARLMNPSYQVARHNALVGQYLEGVERGDILRLMVFEPPRHGKTHLVSELFPGWFLGRNPHKQIIYSTYSDERAKDVGGKVRDFLLDPEYEKTFHMKLDPQTKSSSKIRVMPPTGGERGTMYSVGIGGAVTGRGAHLLIIDDPIKGRQESDSPTRQRQLRDWFTSVAYTRLMPGKSAIIIVMTRWTFDDLAGWLLEDKAHENWTVLCLPALAESDDQIGREPGQALWPEAYPRKKLLEIKATLTSREWNALYQQKPLPDRGGIVDLNDFGRYSVREWKQFTARWMHGARDIIPPFGIKQIIFSWDTAFKEEQVNDPSACGVWGVSNAYAYLLWIVNKRMKFPVLKRKIVQLYEQYRQYGFNNMRILIEDKASGQSMIQQLRFETKLPVLRRPADANKILRMENNYGPIESGRVLLPDDAPWLSDFETQIVRFPFDKNDDMVDQMSQFLSWWIRPKYVRTGQLHWK